MFPEVAGTQERRCNRFKGLGGSAEEGYARAWILHRSRGFGCGRLQDIICCERPSKRKTNGKAKRSFLFYARG